MATTGNAICADNAKKIRVRWILAMMFAIPISLVALASEALAIERDVNCDAGDTIMKALDIGKGSADVLVLFVAGTCEELVTINRDRVNIEGTDGATIIGRVRIFGPSNVVLRNLTITGPAEGILALGGRTRIIDVNVMQNQGIGVAGRDGATIRINRGQIVDNYDGGLHLQASSARVADVLIAGHGGSGITADQRSSVEVLGGQVIDNEIGVGINGNSSLSLDGTEVVDNREFGVLLSGNSYGSLSGATVTGNGRQGVELGFNSSADIVEGTISGNGENGIYAAFHSMVGVVGTEIAGNGHHGLSLVNDAGLVVYGDTHIGANNSGLAVVCVGDEASLEVQPPAVVGPVACSHEQF